MIDWKHSASTAEPATRAIWIKMECARCTVVSIFQTYAIIVCAMQTTNEHRRKRSAKHTQTAKLPILRSSRVARRLLGTSITIGLWPVFDFFLFCYFVGGCSICSYFVQGRGEGKNEINSNTYGRLRDALAANQQNDIKDISYYLHYAYECT